MKTALCISGQPRALNVGPSLLRDRIQIPNNADVFYHTWHDESQVGHLYNSTQSSQNGRVGFVKAGTAEYLSELFKPVKTIVEPQRDFSVPYGQLRAHHTANQEILASQFYSEYMANQLKCQYEKENDFKYDVVFKTRFDLFYDRDIVASDYEDQIKNGKIVVMEEFQKHQEAAQHPSKPMTDIFAFGMSEKMDIFCSVFRHMERLNSIIEYPFSEHYHGHLVRVENGIELEMGKFDLELLQRMMQV